MSSVLSWVLANKALLSYPLGIIAAGLEVKGQKEAAAVVALVAAWLNGGGHLKSDSFYKD